VVEEVDQVTQTSYPGEILYAIGSAQDLQTRLDFPLDLLGGHLELPGQRGRI
jgi:hypothetical protein